MCSLVGHVELQRHVHPAERVFGPRCSDRDFVHTAIEQIEMLSHNINLDRLGLRVEADGQEGVIHGRRRQRIIVQDSSEPRISACDYP